MYRSIFFTRPAYFDAWDFSNTGQIGGTIGGITSPIINLIGALLVYFSFQQQLRANQIQINALDEEKERNRNNRKFENYHSNFEAIKNHLDNLEFIVRPISIRAHDGSEALQNHVVYRGLNALNELALRMKKTGHMNYRGEDYEFFGTAFSFCLDLLQN